MQIEQNITWQPVNWPSTNAAAHYAIYTNAATSPSQIVSTTNATVSYDDSLPGTVFLIRPCDAATSPTAFGPAQSVVVSQQPLNNRAWLRSYVRKTIADRYDLDGATPTITDDELTDFINDAIRHYSQAFPLEKVETITLGYQVRDYNLPADWYSPILLMYDRHDDSNFQQYLKEQPYKGGESTATSWLGYPKLGILQPPVGGRFYPGHFDVYDGQIHLDFDPRGDGDTLVVRYGAIYPYPTDEITDLATPELDVELLSIYVQALAWKEIESKDVRLSRWRDKQDGGRRDDLPTEKMSTRLFNAWNQAIKERLSYRPKTYRLVRR